ncbi:MAG TPA: hypothetical protein VFG83_10885 [Kofleriaceae bacterium]|nr:hypothetical protein [Kofleriaceae bacterium]
MYAYQDPAARMTLGEGLEEYYASIPGLINERDASSPEAAALFHGHDRCHVVFGCDTSYVGESMVDTWTLFGSDVGTRRYLAYARTPEVKAIFRDIGRARSAWIFIASSPRLLRVIARARAMTQKWPFDRADEHLDRPLDELRAELGIRIIT